jgi:hypothetical protein
LQNPTIIFRNYSITLGFRASILPPDKEMLSKLDEIFPGPGGAAPEAYAW